MGKTEKGRRVAPADKEDATKKDEEWKKTCKECEILKLYNDCIFGCELIKASLNKKKSNEK